MLRKMLFSLFALAPALISCTSLFGQYRTTYDDSDLQAQGPFTLMPFNRMVASAGAVVTFGDPKLENHALDLAVRSPS
jgi:hypothetical protein